VRILVTGATGFIGTAFRRAALVEGHQLAGLIRPEEAGASLESGDAMRWLEGTLAEPPWSEIAAFEPEACVHTAWITTPGSYLDSPENALYYEWSLGFLKGLARLGARHVIVLGTCIEYQLGPAPLSESNTPLAPSTPYARWKNELRSALELEFAKSDVALCWARLFYPYGVGEHPQRLCSTVIRKLLREEKVVLQTPRSTKDYIYVDDAADALLMIVDQSVRGPINLGTGQGVTVREIADLSGQLVGRPELIEVASQPSADAFSHVVADASRLRSLGWRPKFSLEVGLNRLIQHLRL
jgi:nucleoside-diphosphate-sugar epimerase